MLKILKGLLVPVFLLLCFALTSVKMHSENVVVTGLDLQRDGKSITISFNANVKTAQFNIFRGYSPLRGVKILSNALLIASATPEGEKIGKNLYHFSPFTDTITFEANIFYLVLPDKDSYTAADFKENENFNTKAVIFLAGGEEPAPSSSAPPAEILIDDTPDGLRIRVSAIQFDVNSAVLTAESRPVLDRVYDTIKKILDNPEANNISANSKIEIGGHTDDVGSAQKNQGLSKRRALSVMTYLVKKGLNAKNMTAVGYGGTKPVKKVTSDLSKDTAGEYRALNRRVEFFIRK